MVSWVLVGLGVLVLLGLGFFYFAVDEDVEITDFASCIAAGNPAMESYPRQCRDASSDRTFVEGISPTDCLDMGGRTLNTVVGDVCYDNETNFSPVVGFISPNICCIPNGS